MPNVGKFCKAYYVRQFREYPGWREATGDVRTEGLGQERDRSSSEPLGADDYLFLQENYVVTDGVFMDQGIVFQDGTPEWKDFCDTKLGFRMFLADKSAE